MSVDGLRRVKRWLQGLRSLADLPRTIEQAEVLQREVERLRALNRQEQLETATIEGDAVQTRASFDFQWQHMPSGTALPTDAGFMAHVAADLTEMVGQPSGWFQGRRIVDIGCGIGRYTFGFLQLGADVTACDQSAAALQRTAELCQAYRDRLTLNQIDLLQWDEEAAFDLAFCLASPTIPAIPIGRFTTSPASMARRGASS